MANLFHADAEKILLGENKFDSRRRFLRIVTTGHDAYFSTGKTFEFQEGRFDYIGFRYRNGPYTVASDVVTDINGGVVSSPPAVADTSVKVKF